MGFSQRIYLRIDTHCETMTSPQDYLILQNSAEKETLPQKVKGVKGNK